MSGAAVRATAVRLRGVRKSGSATVRAATSATRAMSGMNPVSRWAGRGPLLTVAGSAAGSMATGVLIPSLSRGPEGSACTAPVEVIWANNHTPRGVITRRERLAADEICEFPGGLPVATAARTALDLGRYLPFDKAVAHLDDIARVTRVTGPEILALTQRYAGARGVRCCRTAVDMMDSGAQSPKETWLRLLLIRSGYDRPQTQIPLYEYGAVVASLDMGWPQIRVAVEYDGDQHRTDRDTYVKDMRRANSSIGWAG